MIMNWKGIVNIVVFVCCFTAVHLADTDGDNETTTDGSLDDRHVVLGPPINLTVLYVGEANIVIMWEPPIVYRPHEINTTKAYDEIMATKHSGSYVAVNVSQEEENGTSTTAALNGTDEQTDSQPPTHMWKCEPLSFFANYTVGLDAGPVDSEGYAVIRFKNTPESLKKEKVRLHSYNKIVPHEEGCLTGYTVLWKLKDSREPEKTLEVASNLRQVNITDLQSDKDYEIKVRASFVSGDSFETPKPITVHTREVGQSKTCKCDMFGALVQDCNGDEGPPFCSCKQGYEGPFCENCMPGYYRTAPYYPCHRCPCSAHSSRKSTCSFREGFLQCDECEDGYRGNICHLCDLNYYRLKGRCVACFCHGHTAPNAKMCRQITGECLQCQHNTTGFNCERCLPGYQRDPAHSTLKPCYHASELPGGSSEISEGRSSSSVSPGVIGAIIVVILLLVALVIGALWLRRNRGRRANWKFWTVEMKRDNDDLDFTSVNNDDAHMDDVDDLQFYEQQGGKTSLSKYARLHEQL